MSSYAEYEAAKTTVGKMGLLQVGPMKFAVKVKDVAFKFGNLRYLVSPIAGENAGWVEKVEFAKKKIEINMDDMIVQPNKTSAAKSSSSPAPKSK